jgi:hypothetical protein
MKLLLAQDSTLSLDLQRLADGINTVQKVIECSVARTSFRILSPVVMNPASYRNLPAELVRESEAADLTMCCTSLPYDNNYFWDAPRASKIGIYSFYEWEYLTQLPRENGLTYFIATTLAEELPFRASHNRNTGCINDFLGDKRGIDIGMRSASICASCMTQFEAENPSAKNRAMLEAVGALLDRLSAASRVNASVMTVMEHVESRKFDVFMCHGSADKVEVRALCRKLKDKGLRPWLDEDEIRPGLPWQSALEAQISTIGAAAVCVGQSALTPWQQVEISAFLSEFMNRKCPVIPVLLPSAGNPPSLPIFLRQMEWIDFRSRPARALARLIWGVTGRRPDAASDEE